MIELGASTDVYPAIAHVIKSTRSLPAFTYFFFTSAGKAWVRGFLSPPICPLHWTTNLQTSVHHLLFCSLLEKHSCVVNQSLKYDVAEVSCFRGVSLVLRLMGGQLMSPIPPNWQKGTKHTVDFGLCFPWFSSYKSTVCTGYFDFTSN